MTYFKRTTAFLLSAILLFSAIPVLYAAGEESGTGGPIPAESGSEISAEEPIPVENSVQEPVNSAPESDPNSEAESRPDSGESGGNSQSESHSESRNDSQSDSQSNSNAESRSDSSGNSSLDPTHPESIPIVPEMSYPEEYYPEEEYLEEGEYDPEYSEETEIYEDSEFLPDVEQEQEEGSDLLKLVSGIWYLQQNDGTQTRYTGIVEQEDAKLCIINGEKAASGILRMNEKCYWVGKDGELLSGWTEAVKTIPEKQVSYCSNDAYQTRDWLREDHPGENGEVSEVKVRLQQLGFYSGKINDYYDATLTDAVTAFQKSRSMVATGTVDGSTWRELYTYHVTIPEEKVLAKMYFDPETGEALQDTVCSIDDVLYGFDANGFLHADETFICQGMQYQADSEGHARIQMSEVEKAAKAVLDEVGWNLRAAFDWCVGIAYSYSGPYYCDVPENTDHAEFFAEIGFRDYFGNCYMYAACFYEMAKLLGYDVRFMEGNVGTEYATDAWHGWTEIIQNGTAFVFDPEFEHEWPYDQNGYGFKYGTTDTWIYHQFSQKNS